METEEWQGLTVRARDGSAVGVVVGVFAGGPLAGRLCVHGAGGLLHEGTEPPVDTAVYAIPRRAVVRREQDSLLLGVTLGRARGNWLMHVLRRTAERETSASGVLAR